MSARRKLRARHKEELLHAKNQLGELRDALTAAYFGFEQSADPDTVDACIFEINALRARYNSAIRQIKSIGL